jgi:hypothetical protein
MEFELPGMWGLSLEDETRSAFLFDTCANLQIPMKLEVTPRLRARW